MGRNTTQRDASKVSHATQTTRSSGGGGGINRGKNHLFNLHEKSKARQGKARQSKARQGKARQGKARQNKARQAWESIITYPNLRLMPATRRTVNGTRSGGQPKIQPPSLHPFSFSVTRTLPVLLSVDHSWRSLDHLCGVENFYFAQEK